MILGGTVLLLYLTTGLVAQEPERNALFYLREGERYTATRDYRAAAHSFRLAIKKNPGHARAHLGAARAYYEMNDLNSARAHYARVLELDSNNLAARIGLGLTYVRLGQFGEAGRLLREVQAKEPGSVANNYALGLFYHRQGNLRLSEAYYQKAIRVQPSHVSALVGLARVKADQKRPDLSEELLRRARLIDPGEPEIYSARGLIELRRAFAYTENNPDERSQALENAYEALLTAHQLAPDDLEIEQHLVRIDLYRNQPDAALRRAEEIVRRSPRNPMLLYMMGTVHLRRGGSGDDVRAAVRRMQQALELDPGDSLIRFGLEEVLLEHPEFFPATGALRRGLAGYHYERARHYASIQRRDLMQYNVRRTLKLYPFHEPALRLELDRYLRDGDYEKFILTLRRLLKVNPDDLKLRHRLELALREKNKSLAYRAGLFHAGSNPDQANYKRTPLRVFIFDFQPAEAFPGHPDGPDRMARALAFELEREGSVEAVSPASRAAVLGRIRQLNDNPARYIYGVYYRPEFINLIEDEQEADVTHVVSGSYRTVGEGFELTYEVTEKVTGTLSGRFTLRANGRDALPTLAVRAADRIVAMLGARGRVIRVRPDEVYVNLGTVDGVKPGTVLRISRLGSGRGSCVVQSVASYIALCKPGADTTWDKMDPGDTVLPARK